MVVSSVEAPIFGADGRAKQGMAEVPPNLEIDLSDLVDADAVQRLALDPIRRWTADPAAV